MDMRRIEEKMRALETVYDRRVDPSAFVVVRLDGRGFHALVNEMDCDRPFDDNLRAVMVDTCKRLMSCGFKVACAHTQSDEVSLLLEHPQEIFAGRHRKLLSVLAGEASAALSLGFGRPACADARILELESAEEVGEYFAWRQADAERNCLLAYCYWTLRDRGRTPRQANRDLHKRSRRDLAKMLKDELGLTEEELPQWQRFGSGLFWESYEKEGVNPLTGEVCLATRQRIRVENDLPQGNAYIKAIVDLIAARAPNRSERTGLSR